MSVHVCWPYTLHTPSLKYNDGVVLEWDCISCPYLHIRILDILLHKDNSVCCWETGLACNAVVQLLYSGRDQGSSSSCSSICLKRQENVISVHRKCEHTYCAFYYHLVNTSCTVIWNVYSYNTDVWLFQVLDGQWLGQVWQCAKAKITGGERRLNLL